MDFVVSGVGLVVEDVIPVSALVVLLVEEIVIFSDSNDSIIKSSSVERVAGLLLDEFTGEIATEGNQTSVSRSELTSKSAVVRNRLVLSTGIFAQRSIDGLNQTVELSSNSVKGSLGEGRGDGDEREDGVCAANSCELGEHLLRRVFSVDSIELLNNKVEGLKNLLRLSLASNVSRSVSLSGSFEVS